MKNTIKFIDPKDGDNIKKDEKILVDKNYLPIDILPSRYRLYPPGSKLLARPLNVLEVKLLASMNETNYDFVINDVLRRTTKGIPVEEILVADKFFIVFWLRANTYRQSGYELDFHCPKCSNDTKYNFSIEILEVEYIKEDYDEHKAIELPNSKDKVVLRCTRIKDENKVNEFIKRTKGGLSKYDEQILGIASLISTVNENAISLLDAYGYLESKIHPIDFSYMLSYVDSISFGVKNEVKALCNICREESPVGVTFRPEFFIPKYKF